MAQGEPARCRLAALLAVALLIGHAHSRSMPCQTSEDGCHAAVGTCNSTEGDNVWDHEVFENVTSFLLKDDLPYCLNVEAWVRSGRLAPAVAAPPGRLPPAWWGTSHPSRPPRTLTLCALALARAGNRGGQHCVGHLVPRGGDVEEAEPRMVRLPLRCGRAAAGLHALTLRPPPPKGSSRARGW